MIENQLRATLENTSENIKRINLIKEDIGDPKINEINYPMNDGKVKSELSSVSYSLSSKEFISRLNNFENSFVNIHADMRRQSKDA